MKLTIFSVVFAVCSQVDSFAVSDIISSYAKVSVNNGSQHNESTTLPPDVTTELVKNNTDLDDETPEYDDFDDNTASPERSSQSSGYDSDTMIKYFNGIVNLLALMYKFSGKSDNIKPESLHFSKAGPRSSDGATLANNVNQLAEDRYNPTTATKKFKAKQGAYSTMNLYPVYNPASPAETYSSNDGKTSYDSDSSQYMIDNPENNGMKPNKENSMAGSYKPKSPMTDYMNQNEPLDIQQSYSYELPEESEPEKTEEMDEHGSNMQTWDSKPIQNNYNPWKSSEPKKPSINEINLWEEEPKEKPQGPVSYPWMNNSKKKIKPPMEHFEEDVGQYGPMPPKTESKKPSVDEIHLWEEEPNEKPHGPVSNPWMNNSKKKIKPPMEPFEEDDGNDGPMSSKPNNLKESLYYPWLSSKKPKPVPPPAEEEEEEGIEDHDPSTWGMKPPAKQKPPKHLDDHSYPYLHDEDHHGVVYHDDHLLEDHFHDEKEEDHQLKDEDRESKRPYTYYHLGRKLWYVPLLFSLYFIVYIASLILKSIARHKVQFPEKLWELHDHDHHHGDHNRRRRQIEQLTETVYNSLEKVKNKYK